MTSFQCPRCGEELDPVDVSETVTAMRCRNDDCAQVNRPGTLRGWLARCGL